MAGLEERGIEGYIVGIPSSGCLIVTITAAFTELLVLQTMFYLVGNVITKSQ